MFPELSRRTKLTICPGKSGEKTKTQIAERAPALGVFGIWEREKGEMGTRGGKFPPFVVFQSFVVFNLPASSPIEPVSRCKVLCILIQRVALSALIIRLFTDVTSSQVT